MLHICLVVIGHDTIAVFARITILQAFDAFHGHSGKRTTAHQGGIGMLVGQGEHPKAKPVRHVGWDAVLRIHGWKPAVESKNRIL